MVEIGYLASAAFMGLLLIAVAAAVARHEGWVSVSDEGAEHDSRWDATAETLEEVTRSPTVWTLTFVSLTIGVGVAVILFVGGGPLPEGSQALAGMIVAGILGLVVCGFLFAGTYLTAKSKGRSTAWGVAEGTAVLGLLIILVIVLSLVVG